MPQRKLTQMSQSTFGESGGQLDNTVYGARVLDHEEQISVKLQSKVIIYHQNVRE